MVYGGSRTRRKRSTKAEMTAFRTALHALVQAGQPMTVRHAFYRAVATGLVEKTEAGYGRVQRQLVQMRRVWWSIMQGRYGALGDRISMAVPFDWIADNTRWTRKPRTWESADAALRNTLETYRRDLWMDAPAYVEVWCESDSIAGVLAEATYEYDVPLQVVRGFSSITYLYGAAQAIAATGKPAFLYYFGDYDKAGGDIERNVEKDLREFGADEDVEFERVAITAEQIEEYDLPTKPGKDAAFGNTVELEALDPRVLRDLCRSVIEQHVDRAQLDVLLEVEESERDSWMAYIEARRGVTG
jgi:hypothetical protein